MVMVMVMVMEMIAAHFHNVRRSQVYDTQQPGQRTTVTPAPRHHVLPTALVRTDAFRSPRVLLARRIDSIRTAAMRTRKVRTCVLPPRKAELVSCRSRRRRHARHTPCRCARKGDVTACCRCCRPPCWTPRCAALTATATAMKAASSTIQTQASALSGAVTTKIGELSDSAASSALEVSAVLFSLQPCRIRRDTAPKIAISLRSTPPRHMVSIDLTVVDVDDESPICASRSVHTHVNSLVDLISAGSGGDGERAAVLPADEGVRGARGKSGSADGAFDRDDELTTSHSICAKAERTSEVDLNSDGDASPAPPCRARVREDAAVGDEAHEGGDGRALTPFQ
eukprot:IDg13289t1